jgi:hypothetical protein
VTIGNMPITILAGLLTHFLLIEAVFQPSHFDKNSGKFEKLKSLQLREQFRIFT